MSMKVLRGAFKKGSAILERLYSKTTDIIKGLYYRRKSQYTHTGKVALCCIAKMENDYIRFFVDYYQKLHFDKVFIYDNNDPDGERIEEVVGDYIDNGFVEIVDYRGRRVAQLSAYQDCYDKNNKDYDWIAFFDCDEFLTFADEREEIHTFLNQKKFLQYQVLHINWKCYGDNELLDYDGRNVVERFVDPIPDYMQIGGINNYGNNHIKSLIRGGLYDILWNVTPHTPTCRYLKCCNPEGFDVDVNSAFQEECRDIVCLRHYYTKTIGEWVRNKMQRGIPDRSKADWDRVIDIESFFKYNIKTAEKVEYAKRILEDLKK